MSRPRFLADEDFRFVIVQAVRRLEPSINISTVQEIGRDGRSDSDLLEYAAQNNLIVLSHDVNTLNREAELRIADGRGISGVMFTPQRCNTREVAESILMIWGASEAEEWQDRIQFLPLD